MISRYNGPRWFYLGSELQARVSVRADGEVSVQARRETVFSAGFPTPGAKMAELIQEFLEDTVDGEVFVRDGNIVGSGWIEETDLDRAQVIAEIARERFAALDDAVKAS